MLAEQQTVVPKGVGIALVCACINFGSAEDGSIVDCYDLIPVCYRGAPTRRK